MMKKGDRYIAHALSDALTVGAKLFGVYVSGLLTPSSSAQIPRWAPVPSLHTHMFPAEAPRFFISSSLGQTSNHLRLEISPASGHLSNRALWMRGVAQLAVRSQPLGSAVTEHNRMMHGPGRSYGVYLSEGEKQ